MAPPSDLDSLKKKRDIINARIRLMQNKEQFKERKDNTRRKILIGSYYLEQAYKNNSFDSVVKLMDSYLTRDSDRMLFDLSPIKKQ
jgi:large subunit ribosomal protein L7/L12